jgi:hypothetical protein
VAEVVIFHHTLGLTGPVRRFAGELRAAGHTVHTPDLYDGRTFETYEDGSAHSEKLGGPMAIVERARAEALRPLRGPPYLASRGTTFTTRRFPRPVATHGDVFRLFEPISAPSHLPRLATGCNYGLHKGSIVCCLHWRLKGAGPLSSSP